MIAAYAVIITGGLLITARLRLLTVAGSFWVTLVIGLGLLAATGHCMTARWAFAPVCGFDFWRVIVTSPEVLIFLFFMITDPKTVPTGRVGRALFGVLVGVASTLLIASQTNEFGTKVALLGGLVVVCAARPILDRLVPEPQSAGDQSAGSPAVWRTEAAPVAFPPSSGSPCSAWGSSSSAAASSSRAHRPRGRRPRSCRHPRPRRS